MNRVVTFGSLADNEEDYNVTLQINEPLTKNKTIAISPKEAGTLIQEMQELLMAIEYRKKLKNK